MLLVSLLCYAGFTALCLSMDRHHADLLGRKPSQRLCLGLKLAGGLLLVLSLWIAVSVPGWALGLVEWFAVLMLSALLLVPAPGVGAGRTEPVGQPDGRHGAVLNR
jgi:hypothetical protein